MLIITYVLLNSVKENMILAKDVLDECGRTLLTTGTVLKSETIVLMGTYGIDAVWIQDGGKPNREVSVVKDIVNTTTRLKLLESIENAFYSEKGIATQLTCLQGYVEQVVRELSGRKDVLLYLSEIRIKSEYLFLHSVNVGLFSIVIGKAMGLSEDELCILGMGGLLHDLGKTLIAHEVINKQGALTTQEFNIVKEHAVIGYDILKKDTQVDERIMAVALQHHERYDGRGYPHGLAGMQIHPLARIVAVADVYDALTTDRVYRLRITPYEAIEIITSGEKVHFDCEVISKFKAITVPYHIGNLVKLDNGLCASVLRLNTLDLARPVVWTVNGMINLFDEPEVNILMTI